MLSTDLKKDMLSVYKFEKISQSHNVEYKYLTEGDILPIG